MPCELNRNNASAIAILVQHTDFADEVFGEKPHEHRIVCNEISPPNIWQNAAVKRKVLVAVCEL